MRLLEEGVVPIGTQDWMFQRFPYERAQEAYVSTAAGTLNGLKAVVDLD